MMFTWPRRINRDESAQNCGTLKVIRGHYLPQPHLQIFDIHRIQWRENKFENLAYLQLGKAWQKTSLTMKWLLDRVDASHMIL